MDKRTCRWHGCNNGSPNTFEPARKTQDFCCNACREARAQWRQRRGSTLVDLLIEGKWKELREARAQLKSETGQ